MSRIRSSQVIISVLLLAATGCVRQGAHSIRRCWADFNTLHEPALFWEQVDHLPYHRRRVAQFRSMYGKDPGHQYDRLKFDPPQPEEIVEIPEPVGLPLSPQSLWRDGIPAPILIGNDEQTWRSMRSMPRLLPAPGDGAQTRQPEKSSNGGTPDDSLPPLPQPLVPVLPPPLKGVDAPPDDEREGPRLHRDDSPPPRRGVPIELPISKRQRNVRLTSGRLGHETDGAQNQEEQQSD